MNSSSQDLHHFLSTDQCSKKFIDEMFESFQYLDKEFSNFKFKQKLSLAGQGIQSNLYFDQPSTRTYYSFFHALSTLGVSTSSFQPGELNSTLKGESTKDTLHTLANYCDLLVIRTKNPDLQKTAVQVCKEYRLRTKIINAGNHQSQHPTQALLDILTLLEHCQKHQLSFSKLNFLIVGDIDRGRAAKSFLQIIKQYGAKNIKTCTQQTDIHREARIPSNEISSFQEEAKWADVVYMTRVQNEYGGPQKADFVLNDQTLKSLKPTTAILHPLPRREELPPSIDKDPRALYWRQEQIGLLSRIILCSNLLKIKII